MSSPQFTPNAAIDLTTISIVHKLLRVPLTNDTDDDLIQLCITAASQEWIWRTARGPEGEVATESPFVAPVAYTEVRDGNGSYRLILRNWPITSVESLLVSGQPFSQSTGFGSRGWVIDGSKKSIVIRTGGSQSTLGRASGGFDEGIQNVEVQYHAGFTGVPLDIQKACTHMVAINYKRTEWLDMASKSMSAGGSTGTTSYRSWELPPEILRVMHHYTRDTWV